MNKETDWRPASRRRVDEAMRRASYKCPKGKEFVNGLSQESMDALGEAAKELEKDYVEGVE